MSGPTEENAILPPTYTTDIDRYIPGLGYDYVQLTIENEYYAGCQARTRVEEDDRWDVVRTNYFCGEEHVYLNSLGRTIPVCPTHLRMFYPGNDPSARFEEASGINFHYDLDLMREILNILVSVQTEGDHGTAHSIAVLRREIRDLEPEVRWNNIRDFDEALEEGVLDIFPRPALELMRDHIHHGQV